MPFPTPGHHPNSGIEPTSLVSSALAGRSFTTSLFGKHDRDVFYLPKCLSPFSLKSTDLISVTIDFFFYSSHLVTQSGPTLCDPMDCNPPGFSVHGLLQARILGWVAISFSRGSSQPTHRTWVSCIGRWILYHWATREVRWKKLNGPVKWQVLNRNSWDRGLSLSWMWFWVSPQPRLACGDNSFAVM